MRELPSPFPLSSFSLLPRAFRPTYPSKVFTTVLAYHQGPRNFAVDLGCGHGTISRTLSPSFTRVIGTDPSSRMIAQATSTTTEPNISFHAGYAQDLDFIPDGTVDLVCAGQAAHWFDYAKVWPVLAAKLRSGGTLAFWGYKDNYFADYPAATKVLDHYCYAPGVDLMGEFWEQPGRNILREKLRDIQPPADTWRDVTRIEYEPGTKGTGSGVGEVLMSKRMKLGEMEGYVRTFSAFTNWSEAHPERKARADGGVGDVVDEMFEKMLEVEPEWKKEGENWRDKTVENEWGSVILLARKK